MRTRKSVKQLSKMMDYHCVVDLSKVADQQLTVRQVINMENVPTTRDPAVSTARGNTIE